MNDYPNAGEARDDAPVPDGAGLVDQACALAASQAFEAAVDLVWNPRGQDEDVRPLNAFELMDQVGARAISPALSQDDPSRETIEGGVALIFLYADRLDDLDHVLRAVAYINRLALPDPNAVVRNVVHLILPLLTPSGKAAILKFLHASRLEDETSVLIDDLMDDPVTRASPDVARAVSTVARIRRQPHVERRALARYLTDQDAMAGVRGARAAEVEQRRRQIAADRPLNVFIGFFGQLREADTTLPALCQSLQDDLNRSPYGPFNLHFGLSTWQKTGNRALSHDDLIHAFSQRCPATACEIINATGAANGRQLSEILPNFAEALIDFVAGLGAASVDEATLKPLLPDEGATILIDDEEDLEARLRVTLAAGQAEAALKELNQFKMWSRVARLRDAMVAQEARSGRAMDVCILMRSDLYIGHGGLGEVLCQAFAPHNRGDIFADFDAHAEYIEGVGDRYMVASRQAAQIIFGLENWLTALNGPTHMGDPLRPRVGCHENFVSGLLAKGAFAHPIQALGFRVHRSVASAEYLLPAVMRDLAQNATMPPEVRYAIDALAGSIDNNQNGQ